MRRLAFIAAASLAFIAISKPPSAEARGRESSRASYCKFNEYHRVKECRKRCPPAPTAHGNMSNLEKREYRKALDARKECFEECWESYRKERDRVLKCEMQECERRGSWRCDDECMKSARKYEWEYMKADYPDGVCKSRYR